MLEEHVTDLLPGYALGCLDEEDLIKVARHLPHCAVCRSELSTYWATVDRLPFAAPLRTPSPQLKSKIMQRAEKTAPSAIASRPTPAPAARLSNGSPDQAAPGRGILAVLRSLLTRPAGLAFGAIILLVIAFMGISNLLLWQQVNALQARVPQGNVQIVRLDGTNNAPQAQGYLMVFKNETYGTLVVENVPRLDPNHQYQLWLIRDGKRTNGGVFSVSEDGYGTLEVIAGQPLETFPSFGITVEPVGGSAAPTGKKILGGQL
jgi:Anti-sigma-K factor rskA, C-terminal/Putative zinc-finger